eukprot:144326-Rhodomonas_salina.1
MAAAAISGAAAAISGARWLSRGVGGQWEGSKPLARAVLREVSARVRLWRRRLAARHLLLEPHPLEAGHRRQQL